MIARPPSDRPGAARAAFGGRRPQARRRARDRAPARRPGRRARSRATGPAWRNASGSGPTCASSATRGSCTRASPAGARTARTRRPPVTTSTTSRSPVRSTCCAAQRRAARAAAQPARRLRRRRHAPRRRHPRRALRAVALGARAGRRRRDGRRRRAAHHDLPRDDGRGILARGARSHTSSSSARPSTTCTRPPTASTSRSARASRSSTPSSSSSIGAGDELASPTERSDDVGRRQGSPGGHLQDEDPHEWCELLDGTDTCFAPVLAVAEAPQHPQLVARADLRRRRRRGAAVVGAAVQPHAGAPTVGSLAVTGQHTTDVLLDWGFTASRDRRPAASTARWCRPRA